jgi:hypothetical protein
MAAEQVIITMAVNFPRIETLYRELISVLCRGRRVTHDGGQGQQFGAEFQSGAIRSVRIYEETDTALIDSKLDDTAGGGKSIRFTDDENVLATQLGGDLGCVRERERKGFGSRLCRQFASYEEELRGDLE